MYPSYIYKIFRPAEWESFQRINQFDGSPDDKRDGFIHLSTGHQVPGTLAKYYTDGKDIILAKVNAESLGPDLKYEVSRGGAEFPHLFAPLKMSSVSRHWVLSPDSDGLYAVDDLLN